MGRPDTGSESENREDQMLRSGLVTISALAVLAAGCGSSSDNKSSTSPSSDTAMKEKTSKHAMKEETGAAMKAGEGAKVKVVSSQFGRIVSDGRGQAFYLFAKEKSKRSECYGACAKAWPPVLTKGQPTAGKGARSGLLGTTKRKDGKLQLTYAGHPMYYYGGDSPGVVKCHNVSEFGGKWLVLDRNGKAVS
jgi:predicted lipoprotein with Yx(FWY)xxD motif